jgi:hypothetical protein
VKVANLYSGHGTYTTLGLTYTDPQVRRRMIEDWFKSMMETAAELVVSSLPDVLQILSLI